MDALFRYLVRYETPIYILLGLGAIFAIRAAWLSWDEWRKAVFGLEKEIAYQRLRTRSAVLILLLMVVLSQFCLVTFIVPYLPSITLAFTSTPDLLRNDLQASAGALETPTADILFNPPANSDCTPGQIIITSLEPRQEISGRVSLLGTANVENFGFYKYEYRQMGSDTWVTIAAGREVVIEAELGSWDTSSLVPGDYEIRLVVTDGKNEPLPACTIPVRVLEP
ncbi:MAG: hypothetical protein RBS68_07615 [Anaerolineales bacterium]|jgi:hypothetical protein|nr:hypothetical protein [Anaerolineales bacterium]